MPGSIDAMRELPPLASVDDRLTSTMLRRSVDKLGGDASAARSSLRLLRADLGTTHASIYAFVPADGAVCIVLSSRQGGCFESARAATPSVYPILSPGGPGYAGYSDDVPAAVAGVVGDDVASLALVDGDRMSAIGIKNNAFFQELDEPPMAGFSVDLRVSYADGSTKTITLRQGPATLTHP